MKYILIYSLMHSFLISYSQITISGKIKNYDGKSKVYYNPTSDGIITAYAHSFEVIPNANGSFKISCKNKGYGTIQIVYNGIPFSFFHTDKTAITFSIDQAKIKFPNRKETDFLRMDHIRDSVKQAATISLDGDYAEVNRFYNRIVRSSTLALTVSGCDFSKLVQKADTPNRVVSIIDSLTQIELLQINDLAQINSEASNQSLITNDVKKFLENQVNSFYGSIFLNAMILKRHEQGRKLSQDPNTSLTIYNSDWERLTEDFIIHASKNISPSPNTFEFNEFILNLAYTINDYQKYDFEPSSTTNDQLIVERLLNPELGVLDSLHLLDSNVILAYKLHNLSRFLNTQTFYSPVLLHAVNEIKAEYPNSIHIKYFEPQIEKLKEYLKTTSSQYDKARIVETNYIQFTDLLETFKGKNILVDVWATWCAPCVEDFNYKSILKPYIDQGKIVTLYISIDKSAWEKKWKENIKFNQLEGYHVLANDVLIKSMWDYLGGNQGAIPRYSLIDKNGNLILNEAARPSQGDRLIQQIESLPPGN